MKVLIHSPSDEELALRARAGSRSSFEELMNRFTPRLFHFLRPRISSAADIEDIIQETFFKLYRNMSRYDPGWRFSTWIYTAASRQAISHRRSSRHKKDFCSLPPDTIFPGNAPGPEERLMRLEEGRNIWGRARNLKPEYFEALWLHYVEELSTGEIAGVMKKTRLSVRLLLHRARLSLARKFREDSDHAEQAVAAIPGLGELSMKEDRR